MKKIRNILFIIIATTMIFTLVGCGENEDNVSKNKAKNNIEDEVNEESSNGENPIATMVVEYINADGNKEEGTIKMELYPDKAPITVANFVNLVKNEFYNGLTFHRIIQNFMIQGGDPQGNGKGGASLSDLDKSIAKGSENDYKYSIKGEFSQNNVKNSIKFEAGTIAMARSDYSSLGLKEEGNNSGCSQFFIMNTDDSKTNAYLEGNYAAFGKVIEGYDVVEKISKTKVTSNGSETSKPVTAPIIKSLTVDTKGKEYKVPETINAEEVANKVQKQYEELMKKYGY